MYFFHYLNGNQKLFDEIHADAQRVKTAFANIVFKLLSLMPMCIALPNPVVVESEEVQVCHLIDSRRYSDELVMIKTQFHHGVERTKKRFRFDSLTVQFVVGEIQVFQTRVHMGKNKTCVRKH